MVVFRHRAALLPSSLSLSLCSFFLKETLVISEARAAVIVSILVFSARIIGSTSRDELCGIDLSSRSPYRACSCKNAKKKEKESEHEIYNDKTGEWFTRILHCAKQCAVCDSFRICPTLRPERKACFLRVTTYPVIDNLYNVTLSSPNQW